jgi:hypothetical protein
LRVFVKNEFVDLIYLDPPSYIFGSC